MDMTVTEQIEAIRRRMCCDYCKYMETLKRDELREKCVNCPLREL